MTQHERFKGNGRVVPQYEIDTLGAPFKVTLLDCVTLDVDPSTGEEKINVPDVIGLINAVVRTRVTHSRKLNGAEIRFVRNALGVKANLIAEFLEMTPEHLSRCEAGRKVMSTMSEKFFRLLAFLATFVAEPEELFTLALSDGAAIEKVGKVRRADEMAKKFVEQFLSMKIESAFDPDQELHFVFSREPVGSNDVEDSLEDEWRNEEREPIAACG